MLLTLFQTPVRVGARANQRQNRRLRICNYSIIFCNCSDGFIIFLFCYFFLVMFPFLKNLVTVSFGKKEVGEFFKSVVDSAIELRKQANEVTY